MFGSLFEVTKRISKDVKLWNKHELNYLILL